jgi:hypothetical protein
MHAKPVDAVSMHDSALNRFLAAQTWLDMLMWGGIGLIMLASVFWLLRAEKHRFDQLGKGRGWIRVRLLALPMLLISAALVVLPARSIPGMEALAYFYFALFTLVPLTWFGLHWLAGAMQTPRFSCGESFTLAFTGLLVLLVPLLLAGMLQGPIFRASHLFSQRAQADVEPSRLALEVQPVQRFRLGSAGEIFSQTLRAPAEIRIERIDRYIGGHWSDTATSTHDFLCRQDQDLHLAWPVASQPDPLRIYWRDREGKLYQAEYRVDAAALKNLPVRDFFVGWRTDGIDLPVPLMRDVVQLGWGDATDKRHYRTLSTLQPGENFVDDCVTSGYRRVAWQQEGPISGVMLRFRPAPPAVAWQAEFRRDPT